jgi:hypothetical protein
MKKTGITCILTMFFIVLIIFTGCITDPEDPCNPTIQDEISAGLVVNVTAVKNNDSVARDLYLNVVVYKQPCGGDPKGHFYFNGFTDENGKFKTTPVYYNLRNLNDDVHVDVKITATGKTYHEIYGYPDFKDGVVSDLYIKIYDN